MIFVYKKQGLLSKKDHFLKTFSWVLAWKLLFFCYTLVLPIYILPFSVGTILLAFVAMHFVTGFLLTVVFQLAHVVPTTEYPLPDAEGQIESEWVVHQLATTSNFAPKSRIMAWMIGGLNHQVEHHLFPDICHIHYKHISPIVEKTAKEFGMPYLTKPTFVSALWDHTRMLYHLGIRA